MVSLLRELKALDLTFVKSNRNCLVKMTSEQKKKKINHFHKKTLQKAKIKLDYFIKKSEYAKQKYSEKLTSCEKLDDEDKIWLEEEPNSGKQTKIKTSRPRIPSESV